MFLTVHATTALIIAKIAPNPIVAFLGGFISHYLLDGIPHGDEDFFAKFDGKKWKLVVGTIAAIDFSIMGLWLIFLLYQNQLPNLNNAMAAVVGSILPDFLNGLHILTDAKIFNPFAKINQLSHRLMTKKPTPYRIGFFYQAIFFAAIIYLLFKL
ncbi:MAG: hypothetical protein JW816_00925 [Candidatus Buchananbacteria bacterium]|nr:hypothetical protein [Candidatus Buchananbacteria bacterium]